MSSRRIHKLPADLTKFSAAEVEKAESDGLRVAAILIRARSGQVRAKATQDSVRQNAEYMDKMRLGSARAMARRIASKEIATKDEFVAMLGGRRRWVNEASKAQRVFTLKDPSGLEYFPAFFADERYDRRALGNVAQALDGLPNESKYFFFMSRSLRLNMTPLEALAEGMTLDVVICAVGFVHS